MDRARRLLLESSGELTQSSDDECLLDAPLLPSQKLQSEIRPTFHPVPTVAVSIILLLIQVAFVALTSVAVYFCVFNGDKDLCKQYITPFDLTNTVIISKVILWLLHVVNERFINHQHCKAKSRGYLNLYRSTRHLKTSPLIIHSTVQICKFNKSMPRPDIIEEEQMHAFQSRVNPGIGFREGASLEDVVEKQGDTIEYLQRHNALLSRQLLSLTKQQT
ncbi:transmembrane protein 192 isoform X2 [Eleutherodactylus coqui]|uniref:Transmembrane protein 192 n=1 Tax=Eleutherodactylus coqui TaxID=57060 RepID=A0A8J6F136_ELECQ|nr:hypothetical protein GDO78_011794 [Eleutherodactylus coqui]